MAYRNEDELTVAVRREVEAKFSNSVMTKNLTDRVYHQARNQIESDLVKGTRIAKHVIWAAVFALLLLFVFLGARYQIQMSSPEGRCDEACGGLGVARINTDDGCICNTRKTN